MQESLAHAQRIVLIIIRSYTDLSDKLLLGSRKLRGSHPDITQAFQFLIYQAGAVVQICRVATEVDAESSRIGIGSQVGFYVIDQPTTFTERNVQSAVHARATQNIVQQIECGTLVIICIISPAANHDMCLMGILMHYKMPGYIEGRWHTAVVHCHGRYIREEFFRPAHHLPKVQIAQNKKDHIAGMVEARSECSGILTAKQLQLPGIAQNVASQGMPSEYQVFEIIEDELGRVVFVGLYLVDNHLRLLLDFALRESGVEYNIR